MDYATALDKLKGTFSGTTETPLWVESLCSILKPSPLRILDVGVGTGSSIFQRLHLLWQKGFSIDLTGIDVELRVTNFDEPIFDNVHFYEVSLEDYTTHLSFDVVNATQSLYYSPDVEFAFKKYLDLTSLGGVIIVTLWSEDCILFQLARKCAADTVDLITAEKALQIACSLPGLESVSMYKFKGTVDLKSWRESDTLLKAAATIIVRKHLGLDDITNTSAKLRLALSEVDDQATRVNCIIVMRKLALPTTFK